MSLDSKTKILTMEYGPVAIESALNERVTIIGGDGLPYTGVFRLRHNTKHRNIIFRQNSGGGGKYRKSVIASADHAWRLRDGSMTLSLNVGDVLKPTSSNIERDALAVVHGLVFGDGTAHKRRVDGVNHFSQGRTYASIRICKQDSVRDEIHTILDAGGFKFTTPAHADGDRVYYIGKLEGSKELPFTCDPQYIAGFIHGWWLADGHKAQFNSTEISTSNELAAEWLETHVSYAGYSTTMHRIIKRKLGDGSYPNGKPLHFLRLRRRVDWKVESIFDAGSGDSYFIENSTQCTLLLSNGLLTGVGA
ncbi:hypothetical protein [Neorhizobium sp. IRS_2294]|uniref:hypothetical protein n=1 Tax=unclassified Neorhizobium TaxID=2629175 RepID=UPI003D2A69C5